MRLAALWLVAIAASLGCQGMTVPLSAQRGSTVLIPLAGSYDVYNGLAIGYGGDSGMPYQDYQRGRLVYQLDTPNGLYDLVTRGTTAAVAHPSSPDARNGSSMFQIFSLVNIPSTVPLGTYPLKVHREYTDAQGQPQSEEISYGGELAVLPASIDVTRSDNSPETIVGAETPFERCNPSQGSCNWTDVSSDVPDMIPDPTLVVGLNHAVWAVDVQITYPDTVINVVDALETPVFRLNHLAQAWFEQTAPGQVTVHAVAGSTSFQQLSIVYQLIDGASQILDPSQVSINVLGAWDSSGAPISVTGSLTTIL